MQAFKQTLIFFFLSRFFRFTALYLLKPSQQTMMRIM